MASKSSKKRTKRMLNDERTNDAYHIIPIKDPREDDIIIPYVFSPVLEVRHLHQFLVLWVQQELEKVA
jgi:hypothetical protein